MTRHFSAAAAGVVQRYYCGGACDGREDGAVQAMLQCQRVSDFLIAAAYLSIPLELLYFASCADIAPLKWLLLQLASFAVLGGTTHLLAVFSHTHPHSSGLLLASTATKLLAALVSFATAVSLVIFIPRLIRAKLREALLRSKARQLDRDLGIVRRRVEATSRVVRMLTHHIRSSPPLDAHTILHTTMLHLADALALHSCAVWMPGHDAGADLHLVHQLSLRDKGPVSVVLGSQAPISTDDTDVADVMASEAAKVLRPGSALAMASSGGLQPRGAVAAIRIPMLKVSNFDGRKAPVASSYAILVLVLRNKQDGDSSSREWGSQDLEVMQVIADQVAVALSHAAVLEEWQAMREKLAEQHRALLHAKHEAMMATNGINNIQSAMCHGMRKPMYSIIGLLSIVSQVENMRPEQRLVADAIARTSTLSLALMNDVATETLTVDRRPFGLHSLIRETMSVTGCLAGCEGVGFSYQLENSLPAWVVGDETRVFHLLLQMVGGLLSQQRSDAGRLLFSVSTCTAGQEDCIPAQPNLSPGCSICVKFQVAMERSTGCSQSPGRPVGSQTSLCKFQSVTERSVGCSRSPGKPISSEISMCKKIVQMMKGSMRSALDGETITLFLQFQLQQSGVCRRTPLSVPRFDGLRILLADGDCMSQAVTQKLLEKLGCQVTSVSSGLHCLALLGSADSSFQLLFLDLDMDAFEVALRIRELRNRCWLLIVAAVAVSIDDSVREMCRRSGINGLIQKPITLAALGAQLYRVVRN
ncbi:ethylene receptor 4-like [Lolium perenne]|uniref:ethylene receptor 4-like n=1 Tax=Lolium perenne TaxID=4522 RepID=UPI0021EA0D01|nr:ethylene receptor 4-like [Lolium perenne]